MPSPTDSASYVGAFDTAIPQVATCTVSQLDDFIRHVKTVAKASFPNVTGAVTPTHTELNYVDGVTSAIQTQLDALTALVALRALLSGNDVLLRSVSISGTPSAVDFVNGGSGVVLSATYDELLFTLSAVKPSTDGAALLFRTSTDGGSTFASTSGDYLFSGARSSAGSVTAFQDSGTATSIQLLGGASAGNASGEEGVSGHIRMWRPSAALPFQIEWMLGFRNTAGAPVAVWGTGYRAASADVDAVRFLQDSGTFASGTIKMFGRGL